MLRPLAAAFLCCLAALPAAAQEIPGKPDPARVVAGAYKVDPAHTIVAFTVSHFGFSNYYGLFGGGTGALTIDPQRPETSVVEITIPLSGVVTTSGQLTAHLKTPDFFDSAKFPTAHFRSSRIEVQGDRAQISGDLTLRGVTKPVVLDTRFTGAGINPMNKAQTIGFEATTTIRRSEFGVSYAVPAVSDDVQLKITAAFEKAG